MREEELTKAADASTMKLWKIKDLGVQTTAGIIDFESGLRLVSQRAEAMQKACNLSEGSMAAVLGLEDEQVETVCKKIKGTVVAANYNCPGQLVISGSKESIALACNALKDEGARRALILPVGGAFHSPLMEPAREELANAINDTTFAKPMCPVYQNTVAKPVTDPDEIQKNLIDQFTQTEHSLVGNRPLKDP